MDNSNAIAALDKKFGDMRRELQDIRREVGEAKKMSQSNREILVQIEAGRKVLFWLFGLVGWLIGVLVLIWDKISGK